MPAARWARPMSPTTCTRQQPRTLGTGMDAMRGGYLGPQFLQQDIEERLRKAGAVFEVLEDRS